MQKETGRHWYNLYANSKTIFKHFDRENGSLNCSKQEKWVHPVRMVMEVQLTDTAVRARPLFPPPPLNLPLVCSSRWFGTGQVGTAPLEGCGSGEGGSSHTDSRSRADDGPTHPTSSRQKELSGGRQGALVRRLLVSRSTFCCTVCVVLFGFNYRSSHSPTEIFLYLRQVGFYSFSKLI